MARPTASELRALVRAKVNSSDTDIILEEAKKAAIRGEVSLDLTTLADYVKLTEPQKELLHAELKTLGFTVEENRQFARYFMELKW